MIQSSDINFKQLGEQVRFDLNRLNAWDKRVGNFWNTDAGERLAFESIKKIAEIHNCNVSNRDKSREFTSWLANQISSLTGHKALDRIINQCMELCVAYLAPYKKRLERK